MYKYYQKTNMNHKDNINFILYYFSKIIVNERNFKDFANFKFLDVTKFLYVFCN